MLLRRVLSSNMVLAGPKMNKKQIAIDCIMRILAASFLSIFVFRVVQIEIRAPNIILTTLLVSESLILLLVIFAKPTTTRLYSLSAIMSTTIATFYFLFIQLDSGVALLPVWGSEVLMLIGFVLQIVAKMYLGRSFGLLPANRGIVSAGPYRIVRHPIYLGYFISHLGFLSNVFSLQNVLILSLLYIFQFIRIINEERVLKQSFEYREYAMRVKKRVVPFFV